MSEEYVWTLYCGRVKRRPKANVDQDICDGWNCGSVHPTEVAAREAHVQRCEQALADACEQALADACAAVKKAEKWVAEARKRLREAEERAAR